MEQILRSRGLKPADLSRMTGIAPPRLSRWFAGDGSPSIAQAHRIATALGTTIDSLLKGDGETVRILSVDQARILGVIEGLNLTADEAISRLKSPASDDDGDVEFSTGSTEPPPSGRRRNQAAG